MIPMKRAAPSGPSQQPDSAPKPTHRHRRACCRSHCRCCGRHFASTDAFDQHRAGSFSARGFDGRHCAGTEKDPRYEPVIGICKISGAQESGGTIWRLSAAAQRARRTFAREEPELAGAEARAA